ncbi:site-2 protease family protein, partial [Candidatus Saccharibacteria bacterium]|nr:site-2 protease family protein [Candidatus Saccharibacteria bacterium]
MNFDFAYVSIVLVVVLISMTMHEAMHAFASNSLGDDTAKMLGRLSFN